MAPKIVVLDGYTLAPAHNPTPDAPGTPDAVSWDTLRALGEVTIHDRTPADQIKQRAGDATIVLTNKVPLTAQTIAQLPKLRYIGVLATGVNIVDLDATRQRGIAVTNAPGYSTDSVAQHVFALLLEITCHTGSHSHAVHAGQWSRCPDFSFTVAPITELAQKTLGIVGLGAIGRRVARIGHALGMRIVAAHQTRMHQISVSCVPIEWLPLDALLSQADVVSLHCPLKPETHHMINEDRLSIMKNTAILINTGRGPLVNEHALADALHRGKIAAAGLDVLSTEPPNEDNPLLTAPRCVITPHTAWASLESRQRLMATVVGNVQAFLNGQPINTMT